MRGTIVHVHGSVASNHDIYVILIRLVVFVMTSLIWPSVFVPNISPEHVRCVY